MRSCREKVRVFIRDTGEILTACKGDNLGLILASKGYLPLPCGGRGLCGLCRVRVEGEVSPPTGNELIHGLKNGERLACQVRVLGDVFVEVPQKVIVRTSIYSLNIVLEEVKPVFKPLIIKEIYELPSEVFLPSDKYTNYLLSFDWKIYGTIGDPRKILLVDLGTTKIAYQLIDIEGKILWENISINPLNIYGSDIITRITQVIDEPEKLYVMKKKLSEELSRVFSERKPGVVFIAGNSVMEHLLLGLPVKTLAEKPFQPLFRGPFITFIHDTPTILAPLIAGYVGGDAYSELIASLKLGVEKPYIIIDLGTNTEVILVDRDRIYATSTPAGPAFEGYIARGSVMYYGGITRVRISGFSNDKPLFKIEYFGKPYGLLGTGVISLVAELFRNGLVNSSGRFTRGYDYIDGLKAFIINKNHNVYFTQRDMREFQKAYAAVKSAVLALLLKSGVEPSDLKHVFVAGSFGSSIEPEDLIDLGLVPVDRVDKIVYG
jgi:uncharacterized 2Fe-2S/4Fe-4S cluster protein (DUF4445 family)